MSAHEKAVEAAYSELDWEPEASCHYCGDYAHNQHRCRSGGSHDFENTGRDIVTLTRDELTAAITAYLASMRKQGWVMVEVGAPPEPKNGGPSLKQLGRYVDRLLADSEQTYRAMLAAKEG